jgi:uncharacterized RDD family membrane protein YckC
MQMTTDARIWLDATVRGILARHALGDAERVGMTYELMSHLHAAAEARAAAAGRSEVAREDLEAALRESGGEEGLAAAFVQPLAKPVQRVLFWRRAGAFAIDVLLVGIAVTFVHDALTFALRPFFGPDLVGKQDAGDWGLFPWGFHDAHLPVALQALIAVASGAVVLAYFAWFEGREGRSLGKRALDMRVMRVDGKPMGYREGVLRNLVKLQPFLLVLDTIFMLLAFRDEKQRISDRIAGTIVVRT